VRPAYLLFFLSGAAALVYQVVWVRSLSLVLGSSHLAVATVLSVYMAGLALGNRLFAAAADRSQRPLRLYGLLECGIGLSALGSLGLTALYPRLYEALAGGTPENGAALTLLRASLALGAIIVPTTLMGGTFPVMTRFVTADPRRFAGQLARLYAINTLGAVLGTLAAGFVLLRHLGATASLAIAVATSLGVGLVAVLLQRRSPPVAADLGAAAAGESSPAPTVGAVRPAAGAVVRWAVLYGVGLSGFCAMGYEVLWTRMLTLGLGTSVYSFTILLAAFLAGIALGSQVFGMLAARRPAAGAVAHARVFAATQVAVGLAALLVTWRLQALPGTVLGLQASLAGPDGLGFAARLAISATLAFGFLIVPALFLGMAVPAAGAALRESETRTGATVGRLLAANTIGAILGPLAAGFVLIQVFGIERSLRLLAVLSLATGALAAAATVARRRAAALGVTAILAAAALVSVPQWKTSWDREALATYVNNTPIKDAGDILDQGDLEAVFYREGINSTVSVLRSLNGIQTYVVNGRAEASSAGIDVQLQRSLGHLPMLLHPDPRRVFILGTGSGMTLGATARHPQVERLVLAEIEAEMLEVGRLFARWNGGVLDDPRLRVVLDDGRNYLARAREQFDMISADPIHPWSGGAGYLYTREFFESILARLAPGGIASQWLPLYELSDRDVRTVVRTYADVFPHVMVFVTYYDALLVGSGDPLVIDPRALERRLQAPGLLDDLAIPRMAGAADLLSYFVMGTEGARRYGSGGDLNTDDNLVLEFSAPASQGIAHCEARNVAALGDARESLATVLLPGTFDAGFARLDALGRAFSPAHALALAGDPQAAPLLAALQATAPLYAPLLFLRDEQRYGMRAVPEPIAGLDFPVADGAGGAAVMRVDVVRQYLCRERALVSFVNARARRVYGQAFVDAEFAQLDAAVNARAQAGLRALAAAVEAVPALAGGGRDPGAVEAALVGEGARAIGLVP